MDDVDQIVAGLSDDVMTAIAECTQSGESHGDITILDHDRYDAINAQAEGVIQINGDEFWFICRDGNWNGTEILGWEDRGQQKFEPYSPTIWAIAPSDDVVFKWRDNPIGLISIWDHFLERSEYKDLASKYAYDRRFSPGHKTEKYWKDRAAKGGFVLVPEDRSKELRTTLRSKADG